MKDRPLQNKMRELLWRRKPTEAEMSALRSAPEIAADLELETRLTDLLTNLPEAPVSSNFTARLMQVVEAEAARPARRWKSGWNWHALLPRLAVTVAVLLLAGLSFHHYELTRQRTALAKNVALVAEAQPLPSVDALKNFDAIQRMSQPAHADEELLALLQ